MHNFFRRTKRNKKSPQHEIKSYRDEDLLRGTTRIFALLGKRSFTHLTHTIRQRLHINTSPLKLRGEISVFATQTETHSQRFPISFCRIKPTLPFHSLYNIIDYNTKTHEMSSYFFILSISFTKYLSTFIKMFIFYNQKDDASIKKTSSFYIPHL